MQKRSREKFDRDWTFHLGDIAIPESVKSGMTAGLTDVVKRKEGEHLEIAFVDKELKTALDPENWRKLTLPHDFVIEGNITQSVVDADTSHGFLPRGVGFYRKLFSLADEDKGRRIVLEFDGVFRNCRVWLNGQILMDHRSGYASFQVDITDAARYGEEGENCLLVRVDASDTEGWWYEGGGIYRHVWLSKFNALHVARWGTWIQTPQVSAAEADLKVETRISNETSSEADLVLKTILLGPDGAELASVSSELKAGLDAETAVNQAFSVKNPLRWAPETPHLYKTISLLIQGGQELDRYETPFGIRSLEFKKDGFFLNGKHTVLKGTCNHQDFAGVGVALPDSLHEYKIKLLKDMGSNAYRCAHHMPAPEILEACDRLGMLVMDENRKLDSSDKGLKDLETLIFRDRNHPSVFMWCLENEEPLQGTERGARIVETLARRCRHLDPTRPTVTAMNHGYEEGGYAEKLDITGFNYGHRDGNDAKYRQNHPDRLTIGTETTSTVSTRGIYSTDIEKGYCNAYGNTVERNAWLALWTCHYEVPWQSLLKDPGLTGIFVWTGFDYRGEPSPCKWPCVNSHFGIMDTCGFPKDEYYYYQANWSDKPLLHLFPHWNWKGREGEAIEVWVHTNCAEVELFLNEASLGKKASPRDSYTRWSVPYKAGVLKAVGSGGVGGDLTTVIETTGAAAALRMEADRGSLKADGEDALPIRVSVVDARGRVVPTACPQVEFSLEGPGRIIGVGNGDPICHERDKAEQRSAFQGCCLVIVQTAQSPGKLNLTAKSPNLSSVKLAISII